MKPANSYETFSEIKERLDWIVNQVSNDDLPLDQALSYYEEAVKLGTRVSTLIEMLRAKKKSCKVQITLRLLNLLQLLNLPQLLKQPNLPKPPQYPKLPKQRRLPKPWNLRKLQKPLLRSNKAYGARQTFRCH